VALKRALLTTVKGPNIGNFLLEALINEAAETEETRDLGKKNLKVPDQLLQFEQKSEERSRDSRRINCSWSRKKRGSDEGRQ